MLSEDVRQVSVKRFGRVEVRNMLQYPRFKSHCLTCNKKKRGGSTSRSCLLMNECGFYLIVQQDIAYKVPEKF